jgi:glycosyltransferase involved in cell wall biosynthesis
MGPRQLWRNKKSMRLLILAKHYLPHYSALSVRLSNIANRFSEKNKSIKIKIVVFDPEGAELGEGEGSEQMIEVKRYVRRFLTSSLFLPQSLNPLTLAWWTRTIRREIEAFHPDAVLATTPPFAPVTGLYLANLLKRRKVPYVVDYRDDLTSYIESIAEKSRPCAKYSLKLANRLMSCLLFKSIGSASLVSAADETLQRELLKKNRRVLLVPNGIDVQEIKELEDRFSRHSALEKNGIPDTGAKIIAYIGDLNLPYNTPEVIFEPMKKLMDKGYNLISVIIGAGSRRSSIEKMANEIGIGSSVYFMGNMTHKDAMELLMASDVAFHTQQEGYSQSSHAIGSKIYDYVGCRLPILALADSGSAISEFIKTRGLGIYVEWKKIDNLEMALKKILDSRIYRENLNSRYSSFVEEFDRYKGIDVLYDSLMEIASGGP